MKFSNQVHYRAISYKHQQTPIPCRVLFLCTVLDYW